MDEHTTDPAPDPGTQPAAEHRTAGTGADESAGSGGERIGQQDPASDGEDPSPS